MDAFRIREDAGALPNTGHLACRDHAKLSNKFDMIGRIHADIFFQERSGNKSVSGEKQRCLLPTGRHAGRCKSQDNACIAVRVQDENITVGVSRPRRGATKQHGQVSNKKNRLQGARHSAKIFETRHSRKSFRVSFRCIWSSGSYPTRRSTEADVTIRSTFSITTYRRSPSIWTVSSSTC